MSLEIVSLDILILALTTLTLLRAILLQTI